MKVITALFAVLATVSNQAHTQPTCTTTTEFKQTFPTELPKRKIKQDGFRKGNGEKKLLASQKFWLQS